MHIKISGNTAVKKSKPNLFECLTCSKMFASKSNLHYHKKVVHDKTYQCEVFCKKNHLNVYNKMHTGVKPHVCSVCNKRFTRIDTLRRHEATHSDEKKFK